MFIALRMLRQHGLLEAHSVFIVQCRLPSGSLEPRSRVKISKLMDCNGLLIHHLDPKLAKKSDFLSLTFEFKSVLMICKIDLGYVSAY